MTTRTSSSDGLKDQIERLKVSAEEAIQSLQKFVVACKNEMGVNEDPNECQCKDVLHEAAMKLIEESGGKMKYSRALELAMMFNKEGKSPHPL